LALQIRVPANRITEMIKGKRSLTADTALRLARFFGTSDEFWMNLQSKYDIDVARDLIAEQIELDVTPMKRAG